MGAVWSALPFPQTSRATPEMKTNGWSVVFGLAASQELALGRE